MTGGLTNDNLGRWVRTRIAIIVVLLSFVASWVAWGAFDLTVNRRAELMELAEDQYVRHITVPARRGAILDRHGEALAVEVEVESVYANPRLIKNKEATAALVAPVLGQPVERIAARLAGDRRFVWLERRISQDKARQVRALNLVGIDLVKEGKRYYPGRQLAAQALGISDIESVGRDGVELAFDSVLRGTNQAVFGQKDAAGQIVFAEAVLGAEGLVGSSVELTIDRTLQHIAETELEQTVRTFEAKAGQIVVMDPATGEILALASRPTFNPNIMDGVTGEQQRDRPVLDVLEPGSIFKIFTLAAALDSGVVRAADRFFCENGVVEMFGGVIHDDHRDGWLSAADCLKRSSNICFAKMATKLGKARLYQYARRFGFGEPTGSDLPFEKRGTLTHFKKWYDIDMATISFGQGVGVTGLQIATGLAAIANGGQLMRPLIARRVVGSEGQTLREFAPEIRRRVVSRPTARLVSDIMTGVTEEGGTGVEGALSGFLVAGKTGTAQKSEGSRGYHTDKWVSSFVGFVPADKPRLVISVIIDEPMINHYGGTVAAPALRRVADQSLRYLGIAPREFVASPPRKARTKSADLEAGADDVLETNAAALLAAAEGQLTVPDLRGLGMDEAFARLVQAGLRPIFQGSGFALDQVPAAGDPIAAGAYVQVNFLPTPEAALETNDAETR